MYFGFTLILTLLTLLTGIIWVIDKFWLEKRRKAEAVRTNSEPRKPNPVVEFGRSFFPVLLAVWIFRSFIFEPFRIPSGSMKPTLLVGDYILVNKFTYGLRLPVLNTEFVDFGEPKRGDVVVFRYPEQENVNYIKRVVGLPGDTIAYRDKQVFVNGELMRQEPDGIWVEPSGDSEGFDLRPQLLIEQLGDVRHEILLEANGRKLARNSWQVPQGHYFMMGDNRDNSLDSRYWGFVPEQNLVGRAELIWWHWNCRHSCVDFGRLGMSIP